MAEHYGKPQNLSRIEYEFARLGEALAALAVLGHQYHLVDGPDGPAEREEIWPRIYFHVSAAPNGRVVASKWELDELGPGWFPTLEAAQHTDGMETQFAGKGGVGRKTVPAVVPGSEPAVDSLDERREKLKRDFLASQRAARSAAKEK